MAGVTRGLVKIGGTHFGSNWSSASAFLSCFPFIKNLVVSGKVKFKVRIHFLNAISCLINFLGSKNPGIV